jgi:transitional endoplasmic reticulum ATPase
LKYGVLLEGGYGTGKTLLAFKLARIAIDNNWIFIYLKDPTQFAECVRMAQVIDHSGNGCVIFVEDIDQVTRGSREAALQDILNTLDGGDTKDMNVITIFTTNHINIINPTFLRGKRVDGIISMGSLDAKTAEAFIRESFRDGNYIIQEDLTEICEFIKDSKIVPAFMAVILERVKTRLILRGQNTVMADDIRKSVVSYLHQVELAQTKDEMETPAETLYRALKGITSDKNSNLEENVRTILKATNYEWDREDPIK